MYKFIILTNIKQKLTNVQPNANSIQFEIKTSELIDEKPQSNSKNTNASEKETPNETEKEKINIINSSKNQKIVFSLNPKEKSGESSGKNNNLLFVCLLCKRKFESEEKLRKHESFSELHKVNRLFLINFVNK